MKKQSLLLLLFSGFMVFVNAQSVPQQMNYQAVARDKSGEPLPDKTIILKIDLQGGGLNQPVIYYSEIHRVITNKFGLFNLVIGKGSTLSGDFNEIPWSTENIWMSVGMKNESEANFTNISSTKLLAVPYAFHAGTASQISGNYSPYVIPGTASSGGNSIQATGPISASSWQVAGNLTTTPPIQYLGTSDLKDLVFKTNFIERMRVLSGGNININNSLTIGVDLTVGRDAYIYRDLFGHRDGVIDSNFTVRNSVFLNTLGGSTINYGPFTVGNVSPTIMTGSLRVDQITNLQKGLNVNNLTPTLFTGTLRVNNATDLYNSFTVNSKASSVMTGTLRVDSNVTFKQHLTLDNAGMGSSHWSNGALIVAGGVGIGQNLNVRDSAKFGGPVEFAGQVRITDDRASYSPDSGSLIVTGGVGIKKQLNVRGSTKLYDSLKVEGVTILDSTLRVGGKATFLEKVNANGQVTISGGVDNSTSNPEAVYDSYHLQTEGKTQGIAIKLNGSKSRDKNYVSFWDANGMQGRIEGVATGEYQLTTEYQKKNSKLEEVLLFKQLNVAGAAAYEASAITDLISASASTTACVGLGAMVCSPIISLIVGAAFNLVGATIVLVNAGIDLDNAQSAKNAFDADATTRNGVTYESGAGDYAEYLELSDKTEVMFPGDIVGVKAGKISRHTLGADKMMVISRQPIVLGNTPKNGNENDYQKVAFLGQVPVRVLGKVNPGDYILPDGNDLGMGKALAPTKIKSSDIKNIVGIAWSASSDASDISTINIAVGLNVNDNQKVIENLRNTVSELRKQVAESDVMAEKLVPGYKTQGHKNNTNDNNITSQTLTKKTDETKFVVPQPGDIVYHEVTKEQLGIAFDMAIKKMEENMNDKAKYKTFLEKYKSDPSLRETTINRIHVKIENAVKERKEMDIRLAKADR